MKTRRRDRPNHELLTRSHAKGAPAPSRRYRRDPLLAPRFELERKTLIGPQSLALLVCCAGAAFAIGAWYVLQFMRAL